MKFDEILKIDNIRDFPGYTGIQIIEMSNEKGIKIYLEYPAKILPIRYNVGDKIRLNIDNVKDSDYKKNWDVYMWGIVYYVTEDLIRISIHGLILEIKGFKTSVNIGEKVYIGLKRVE